MDDRQAQSLTEIDENVNTFSSIKTLAYVIIYVIQFGGTSTFFLCKKLCAATGEAMAAMADLRMSSRENPGRTNVPCFRLKRIATPSNTEGA